MILLKECLNMLWASLWLGALWLWYIQVFKDVKTAYGLPHHQTRRKLLASALIDQGVDVDVIAWSKVGLVVMQTPGSVALGATPQYLAGQYLLQVRW